MRSAFLCLTAALPLRHSWCRAYCATPSRSGKHPHIPSEPRACQAGLTRSPGQGAKERKHNARQTVSALRSLNSNPTMSDKEDGADAVKVLIRVTEGVGATVAMRKSSSAKCPVTQDGPQRDEDGLISDEELVRLRLLHWQ